MKKIFKSALFAAVLAGAACGLASCDNGNTPAPQPDTNNTQSTESESQTQTQEKVVITGISVVASTVPNPVLVSELDAKLAEIQIKVRKSDGTFDKINFERSMISDETYAAIQEKGKHAVEITYEGFKTKITLITDKKVEVDTTGDKVTCDVASLNGVLKGDLEEVPADCDMYVWPWGGGVESKFCPLIDGVVYVPAGATDCCVMFIQKGVNPKWDIPEIYGQTIDLKIKDGKIAMPEIIVPGADLAFEVDFADVDKHLDKAKPEGAKLFAYVTGGEASDYFVDVTETGFTAGNDTKFVTFYYMAADKTADTAMIEEALATSATYRIEKNNDGKPLVYLGNEITFSLEQINTHLQQGKEGDPAVVLPEDGAYELYIYTWGGKLDVFAKATVEGDVVKAFIPENANGGLVLVVAPGAQPCWNNKLMQTNNYDIKTVDGVVTPTPVVAA